MDAPPRTDEVPVRSLLVRAVRDLGIDLDRNAYRLAVFENYTETLVDDAHVFHAVARIELRSLCHRGALGWFGTTLQKYLSTSLRVPIFFEQVVVEGDVATVVENDHAVFS